MHPILFEIGFLKVYSYGFMIALGVCASLLLVKKNIIKTDFKQSEFIDFIILTLFSGIVGARIFYVILNFRDFQNDFLSIFKIWEGGLVLYGGVIFSLIVMFVISFVKKIDFFSITDALVPLLAMTQGFGRVGCFLNGCCWGKKCKLFWAVKFPFLNETIHPVQLYESFYCFLITVILIKLYKRNRARTLEENSQEGVAGGKYPTKGVTTLSYFILYPIGRFFIEFYRGDHPPILFSLTRPQIVSVIIIFIALIISISLNKIKSHGR